VENSCTPRATTRERDFSRSFADPLFSRDSDTLLGRAVLKGTGLSARNDDVLLNLQPTLGAIWQEGAEWTGADGVQIGGITAYTARGQQQSCDSKVAGSRSEQLQQSSGLRLQRWNRHAGCSSRPGDPRKPVKQFRMLGPVIGSTGNGRGELLPAGVRFIATFKDKTEAIVDWSAPDTFALRAHTGGTTTAPELPELNGRVLDLASAARTMERRWRLRPT
jgi:hypothetical protein